MTLILNQIYDVAMSHPVETGGVIGALSSVLSPQAGALSSFFLASLMTYWYTPYIVIVPINHFREYLYGSKLSTNTETIKAISQLIQSFRSGSNTNCSCCSKINEQSNTCKIELGETTNTNHTMNATKNMSFKQIMETAGNLFQNAIRFASTNETKLVITHNKNGNVVEITASDAGPPPIDVSTLFQSSYRSRDEAAILPQEKPETQSEIHEQKDS